MSSEAFSPQQSELAKKETLAVLITTSASVVRADIQGLGPDLMISNKTAGYFFRFGNAATDVSSATAATQGMWVPTNTVLRLKKPEGASHFCTLQDSSAATVYIQPGYGI